MIRKHKNIKLPEIQMTSMPDIIFMLLFFFMVVTVLRKKDTQNQITVPTVSYAELLDRDEILPVLIHHIDEQVHYQIEAQPYADLKQLEVALKERQHSHGAQKVKLVADQTASMGIVNKVKQLLQTTHFNRVEYLVLSK